MWIGGRSDASLDFGLGQALDLDPFVAGFFAGDDGDAAPRAVERGGEEGDESVVRGTVNRGGGQANDDGVPAAAGKRCPAGAGHDA